MCALRAKRERNEIYYGIDNIKENWKQTLKRYDYIIDLCNKFDNIKNK